MIDLLIDLEPEFDQIVIDLREEVGEQITEGMQYIADNAPKEMQLQFCNSPPSSEGQAPANRTKVLSNSLLGKLTDENTVQIQMAAHGFFLDPIFKGAGKGGGWANRPFIMPGLDKTIPKAFDAL